MTQNPLKKNVKFWLGMGLTLLEGLLSGCNFILIYMVIRSLWDKSFHLALAGKLTLLLAGIFALRLVVFCNGYIQGLIGGAQVSKQARLSIGDKLRHISLASFSQQEIGRYINTATSDVSDYEKILTHKSGDLVKNFTMLFMLIGFVGFLWPWAGLPLLIMPVLLIPAVFISVHFINKWGIPKNEAKAENVNSTVEYLSGIQTFRSYGMGGLKNKTAIEAMRKYSHICYEYEKSGIGFGVAYMVLSWLVLPLTMWIAYSPWQTGQIDTVEYLMICLLPLFLAKLSNTIFTDLVSYRNLQISKANILAIMSMPEEPSVRKPFYPHTYSVTFQDVCFSYDGRQSVLSNMNFTAKNGCLTAVVGSSGSGKSTILNLIAQYYRPQHGVVSIGGISTSEFSPEQILEKISIVDQDVFLLNDTIRENIRYARPEATDAEIEVACREANCDGFIRRMTEGYDTLTGENGNLLSGGERQRLSIARAILKNSPILLLDEATASLDIENELAVKQAIFNLLKEKKTVVMVAHTLSIVENSDQILVISEGTVVEAGTHRELLALNGKYTAMWHAEQKLST